MTVTLLAEVRELPPHDPARELGGAIGKLLVIAAIVYLIVRWLKKK